MTKDMPKHRIVVVGAGYAGMMAALRLARRSPVQVTLVNPSARFTERLRMHQIATGQPLADIQIPTMIAGTGIELVLGWVTAIDVDGRHVTVEGYEAIGYDSLIYAVGSASNSATVPGADVHGYTLDNPDRAREFAARLAQMSPGATVTVCGNGLTGIEAAAEIAESHPDLRVLLIGRDEPGAMMGNKGRAYLRDALGRLGVEVRSGVEITKVLPDAVELDGGQLVRCDASLWTTGFWASPLAADAGLTVDPRGRIVVDDALRSISHPAVLAVGDAASIRQPWGAIHGTCQSAVPSAAHAADTVGRLLRGKEPRPFRFGYLHQPVSLGRRDGIVQFTRADDTPRRWCLTGTWARRYKEAVSSSPPAIYRLSRRCVLPRALLSARGGRAIRHRPRQTDAEPTARPVDADSGCADNTH